MLRSRLDIVAAVFVSSRVFFLLVGAVATTRFTTGYPGAIGTEFILPPPSRFDHWAHWDGAWYTNIAADGYTGFWPPLSTSFFPLYPLLIRSAMTIFDDPALWGVVISCAACFVALYFLYRLAEALWNERVARASALALAFFPTSFFLNAVYTEALFLALTCAGLWAALVRRDLLLAGILAGLATATRGHVGLLLLVPLAYELIRRPKEFGWKGVASLALVPAGAGAYMLWLWHQFGDPLVFRSAVAGDPWRRTFAPLDETLVRAWNGARAGLPYLLHPQWLFETTSQSPSFLLSETVGLLILALAVGLLLLGVRLLPLGLWLYAVGLIAFPLLYPSQYFALFGFPRYVLVAFPIFFVLGHVLARNAYALATWCLVSATFGDLLTALFTSWRWVA